MAEGGGPVEVQQNSFSDRLTQLKNDPTMQRAIGIGMRVLGGYLVYKGARNIAMRRVTSGSVMALGGLQLLSGNVPTVGHPLISQTLSRIRV